MYIGKEKEKFSFVQELIIYIEINNMVFVCRQNCLLEKNYGIYKKEFFTMQDIESIYNIQLYFYIPSRNN